MYAKCFDIHFMGSDCPYECEEWDRYESRGQNMAMVSHEEKLPKSTMETSEKTVLRSE